MFLSNHLAFSRLANCRPSFLEVFYYRTFGSFIMEVLYIYNPQNETLMTPHEQEVQELYEKLTVEIPGVTSGRAIGLESFKAAIEIMMNKAYVYGQAEGFHEVEGMMNRVFSSTP